MATPTFILPSAPTYTEGFVNGLNVYPNPTNFVANQVPFTRATTATRTNATGLIEIVPYNIFQYSEQFSNAAWLLNDVSITPNSTTAPNGTLTADTLIGNGVSGVTHRIAPTPAPLSAISGNSYTASCYVKKNTNDFFQIYFIAGQFTANAFANFDVNNGVLGTVGSAATATITNVGNGWYRCSITSTATSTATSGISFALITSATATRNEPNSLSTSIFLWGAQLVEGTDALPYQLTETRLNRPRVDFSLGGCPNLLLEPQRTNLSLFSEQLDDASWTKSNATVTANATTSPSGITNADKIVELATSAFHGILRSVNTVASTYNVSFYAKAAERSFIQWNNQVTTEYVNFDLINGVVGSNSGVTNAEIKSVGNGWYRCSFNFVPTVVGTAGYMRLIIVTSAASARLENYLGNGTSGLFVWGAQFELGAFPTTYIPTSSASVTRNLEVAQLTGAQTLIGQNEGTLYWEGTLSSGFNDIFYLNRSVTNSVVLYKAANNAIIFRIYYGGSFLNTGNATTPYTGTVKIAAAYKSGDTVLYINGVQTGSLATAFAFTGDLADIVLNASGYFFATDFSKNVKSAALYNTRLSNAELATLTTL